MQFSTDIRNARADVIETTTGASPILKIRTGSAPANCAAADAGSVLATINLPADWMAAASNGSKPMAGTWQDASADAAGIAGHFRIYDAGGSVCKIQGTVSTSGADMNLDNTNFNAGQSFSINTFTINEPNG